MYVCMYVCMYIHIDIDMYMYNAVRARLPASMRVLFLACMRVLRPRAREHKYALSTLHQKKRLRIYIYIYIHTYIYIIYIYIIYIYIYKKRPRIKNDYTSHYSTNGRCSANFPKKHWTAAKMMTGLQVYSGRMLVTHSLLSAGCWTTKSWHRH